MAQFGNWVLPQVPVHMILHHITQHFCLNRRIAPLNLKIGTKTSIAIILLRHMTLLLTMVGVILPLVYDLLFQSDIH